MKFFVKATTPPGFVTFDNAARLLKDHVQPSFDLLLGWEKDNIFTGGLPVGGRAFYCVIEAASNDALDAMLRTLPMWSMLEWEVTPLTSLSDRAAIDREDMERLSR